MSIFRRKPKPLPHWTIWEHDGAFWLIGPSGQLTTGRHSKETAERARDSLNRTLAARRVYEQKSKT